MFDEADVLSDLDQLRSRYEILRRLSVDGAEPVYAARIRGTDRHFALKVMTDRARRPASPGALHGWQAHNIEPLEHPKLMTMHAVHHLQGGAVAVAVERRRGRTLSERLHAEGRLAPEEAAAVLRDVAEALAYLHGRGVVHRGVRPESIFLDRDAGCARLAHFGLETDGSQGTSVPALDYLAPEQLKGNVAFDGRRVCPASDLFSLGVTGWELLMGQHPADAAGERGVRWRKDLAGTLADACPWAPPHLVAAIESCLTENPGRRPASAVEFMALLDAGNSSSRRPDEGPDPAVRGRSAGEVRSLPRKHTASLRPALGALNLRKIARLTARRSRSRPDRSVTGSVMWRNGGDHQDRIDTPDASVHTQGTRRPRKAAILLPAISIAAISSVLAVLQLRSAPPVADNRFPNVQASPHVETRDARHSGLDVDLDILDNSASSSYRVRLQPDPPARPPAKADPPRTATRQPEPASPREAYRVTEVPTNRLNDQGSLPGGFVLLGEPIRR